MQSRALLLFHLQVARAMKAMGTCSRGRWRLRAETLAEFPDITPANVPEAKPEPAADALLLANEAKLAELANGAQDGRAVVAAFNAELGTSVAVNPVRTHLGAT